MQLPDSMVHGAYMGPNRVLSAPDGPHVGPMNFAIRVLTTPHGSKVMTWLPIFSHTGITVAAKISYFEFAFFVVHSDHCCFLKGNKAIISNRVSDGNCTGSPYIDIYPRVYLLIVNVDISIYDIYKICWYLPYATHIYNLTRVGLLKFCADCTLHGTVEIYTT